MKRLVGHQKIPGNGKKKKIPRNIPDCCRTCWQRSRKLQQGVKVKCLRPEQIRHLLKSFDDCGESRIQQNSCVLLNWIGPLRNAMGVIMEKLFREAISCWEKILAKRSYPDVLKVQDQIREFMQNIPEQYPPFFEEGMPGADLIEELLTMKQEAGSFLDDLRNKVTERELALA